MIINDCYKNFLMIANCESNDISNFISFTRVHLKSVTKAVFKIDMPRILDALSDGEING